MPEGKLVITLEAPVPLAIAREIQLQAEALVLAALEAAAAQVEAQSPYVDAGGVSTITVDVVASWPVAIEAAA